MYRIAAKDDPVGAMHQSFLITVGNFLRTNLGTYDMSSKPPDQSAIEMTQ